MIKLFNQIFFLKKSPLADKILIINPSQNTKNLFDGIKTKKNYEISYLEIPNLSTTDFFDKINKSHLYKFIVIDELNNLKFPDKILFEINKIRVEKSNILDISDFIEKCFNKVPIYKTKNNWVATKEVINIKSTSHIEYFKRIFDIIIIILTFPIILFFTFIGAILIKVSSKGPIFFIQTRVGKNGKPFNIIKLRTMNHEDSLLKNNNYTVHNDERVFKIGKLLRITKIDELPQFLNILFGQMSLIGPRPERIEIVEALCLENPYYELRHLIRPGITGWAQVNDPTANPSQNFEKLEYDLYYIKNSNLLLDLKIVIKTLIIIIKRNSL